MSAVVPVSANTPAGQTYKPNLILIVVDDLGWGGFGPNNKGYDYTRLNSEFIELYVQDYTPTEALEAADRAIPTLTALCESGCRFSDAYATANVSAPSRAGMLTSMYQERFGFYTLEEQASGIPSDITLMPEVIRANGYTTACIGKWHVGPESTRAKGDCVAGFHPLDRGFDYYWGFNNSTSKYYNSQVLHKGREKVEANGYLTDELTRETIGFIEQAGEKPFMIYLAYNAMHGPLNVPAPDKYLTRFDYESTLLNNYYAYLLAIDQGVKAIMEKLRQTGNADNTMIAFISDNGAPGTKIDVLPKNGPLNGFKGQTWQGGVRVPMFIYVPELTEGALSESIVSTMDIFPTFMELAGIPVPAGIDGRSLVPILKGEKNHAVRDNLVWMGQNAGCWGIYRTKDQMTAPGGFMVRSGKWTLRYDTVLKEFSLYNLRGDIGEKNNIAKKHPRKARELADIFRNWYDKMDKPAVWKEKFWGGVRYWEQSSE
jgi:uncharacterized sulfatase